jgi:E3 ubiquitin-protein ligase UBR4
MGVNRRMSKHTKAPQTGQLMFPADFFEHCNVLGDVEFGGSDLLHVYNVAQLKNRLNNAGNIFNC